MSHPHPPMTDREIARFQFRAALFQRRGLDEAAADALAERLVLRDRERDTRRVCLECQDLQPRANRDGTDGCFAAEQGRLAPIGRFFSPLRTVLQRCPSFSFQRP